FVRHSIAAVVALFLAGALTAFGPDAKTKDLMKRSAGVFGTIPARMPGGEQDTVARIALGKKLYFDVRLSVNDTQSCNTCHRLDGGRAGEDGLSVSPGALPGKKGDRNAPTVLNAGFHLAQFWDGRSKDLTEQAKGPILNPVEMAMPS